MKPYYEHAGITIYHGDCAEIAAALPAASVSLIVTSPPYNQMSSLLGKPSGLWAKTSGAAVSTCTYCAGEHVYEVECPVVRALTGMMQTTVCWGCGSGGAMWNNDLKGWFVWQTSEVRR